MSDPTLVTRNREQQRELYGETLDDIVVRVSSTLGITQGRLAEALGLSPAMLSQLRGGQRVKIGNPAVLDRLRVLDEASAARPQGEQLDELLRSVRERTGFHTRTMADAAGTGDARHVVRAIQSLLRAVAPADELLAAAASIDADHPELAELLRVFGAGRTDTALAHYERLAPMG